MTEIETLVDIHGEETMRKTFWLQEKIRKEGIDGIGYMKKGKGPPNAEHYARKHGPLHVKKAIEDQFNSSI